ncbi:hypothetical protein Pfo_009441 [Paulownia fortunei]|nr:hypothetical protein Pfo_009441 [Paulownia fortunei]
MAKNGVFSRLRMLEKSEGVDDLSPCIDSHEVHVLAVDDSLVDRKVKALQFLGLDDEESSVGFDGLKVDLIITDYFMPGMTGYELLKKIKGSSTFREIPVVIMSSENVLARIDRCLEEGAEDFIVKPVKLSDVKRLKSYMFGEGRIQRQDREFNKRKLQETCDVSLSPSPSSSPSPDEALSSPSRTFSSSPYSPKSLSSLPSRQSMPPPSPTSVDSPTRRLKVSNHD